MKLYCVGIMLVFDASQTPNIPSLLVLHSSFVHQMFYFEGKINIFNGWERKIFNESFLFCSVIEGNIYPHSILTSL